MPHDAPTPTTTYRQLSRDEVEQIITLGEQKMTPARIAREVGRARSTVVRALADAGHYDHPRPALPDKVIDAIVRDYRSDEGARVADIAASHGVGVFAAYAALRYAKTPLRPHAADHRRAAEERIIDVLRHDGRTPMRAIASQAGVTPRFASRIVNDLTSSGRARLVPVVHPAARGLPLLAIATASTAPHATVEEATDALLRAGAQRIDAADDGTLLIVLRVAEAADLQQWRETMTRMPQLQRATLLHARTILKDGLYRTDHWPRRLSRLDLAVLPALQADPRALVTDLAARTGCPPASVRRRMSVMAQDGMILVRALPADSDVMGFRLAPPLEKETAAAAALAQRPEVTELSVLEDGTTWGTARGSAADLAALADHLRCACGAEAKTWQVLASAGPDAQQTGPHQLGAASGTLGPHRLPHERLRRA